jgi:hypothetical protein
MKRKSIPTTILLAVGAALLIACTSPKPFTYHSGTDIPEGPGVLTGKSGAFTIYDSNKKAPAAEQAKDVNGGTPADQQAFRQFQQWQKERKDFEAFQQWKKSRQGNAEYQEFQDWQRWQEYKKWQESQSQSKDR